MYRQLDVDRTVATLQQLAARISERFPDAGLTRVSHDLCLAAAETRQRVLRISRPHYPTRVGVGLFLLLMTALVWYSITELIPAPGEQRLALKDTVELIESISNELLLAGAALVFLFGIEARIKRTRALTVLHELRAIAHVIDMHQLTKDASRAIEASSRTTESSPERTMTAFQLSRYLDYCTELLSIVGKLAALYAQSLPDSVVVGAVNEIEILTSGLSRKIWQKIVQLDAWSDDLENETNLLKKHAVKKDV